jgi:short subunit dehydrogenase-like uncharacterized protein
MGGHLLLYGAAGYTGTLIARQAKRAGLPLVLAGRNERKLRPLATELGLELRVATVGDPSSWDRALDGISAVLNAAGPFRDTAPSVIAACLQKGVHYLDVSGEAAVIEAASRNDQEARRRGIMVMPAVGFDVVPSDCLALHTARRARRPRRLFIGLSGLGLMTRGSAKTIFLQMGDPVLVRRRGSLTGIASGSLSRSFDYGAGPRESIAVTWGDVATAYFSTGIADITVYSEATPAVRMYHAFVSSMSVVTPLAPWRLMLQSSTEWMPDGPSDAERKTRHMVIVSEVEDSHGGIIRCRMRTPDAYSMTATTASALASRVLAGDLEVGFQTPARVYGADYPLSMAGVTREDL